MDPLYKGVENVHDKILLAGKLNIQILGNLLRNYSCLAPLISPKLRKSSRRKL